MHQRLWESSCTLHESQHVCLAQHQDKNPNIPLKYKYASNKTPRSEWNPPILSFWTRDFQELSETEVKDPDTLSVLLLVYDKERAIFHHGIIFPNLRKYSSNHASLPQTHIHLCTFRCCNECIDRARWRQFKFNPRLPALFSQNACKFKWCLNIYFGEIGMREFTLFIRREIKKSISNYTTLRGPSVWKTAEHEILFASILCF